MSLPQLSHEESQHCCHSGNHERHAKNPDPAGDKTAIPSHAQTLKLTLTAMDCPTEAALIRDAFADNSHIHLLELFFERCQ